MRKSLTIALSVGLLGLSSLAFAQEEEPPVGEVHVSMNAEYVKVAVDGEEWPAVEFENSGKRALIKGLDLTREKIEITLTPVTDRLGPVTLSVTPKDFKRKIKKRVAYHIARKKVSFPKRAVEEPQPEEAPEPAPERVEPPKPGEDDDDL